MTDTPSTQTTDDEPENSTDETTDSSAEDPSGLEDATTASSNDRSTGSPLGGGEPNHSGDAVAGSVVTDDTTTGSDSDDEWGDDSVTLEREADAFGPDSEIRRYLAWGGLGVCSLVALVGLFQFYGSVASVIDIWVAPKYEPMARAAFNLAVLLVGIAGVSWSVRELSSNSRP